jgi:hypothetical protein
MECIGAVRKGNLDHNDARAIALLAREVTGGLQAEIEACREEKEIDADRVALIGEMVIGERDQEPAPTRALIKQETKK